MRGAPPELPGSRTVESPIDRALSLGLAGEREAALRWVAAVVQHEPASPSGLLLAGRLLAESGRQEVAREALEVCVGRAIDAGVLPLAVAACSDLRALGVEPGKHFDAIAEAFCRESPRVHSGGMSVPPPPLPSSADEFHPLPSVLSGMALLNKATAIIHDAKRSLGRARDGREVGPPLAPLPLFSSLERSALRRLIEVFEVETVAPGEKVIEQGVAGAEAYIVARGELEVVREPVDGEAEPISLAHLNTGALFGEMALLSRAPRAASVVARKASIVLVGRKDALDRVAEAAPEVAAELAAHTRRRMVQNLVRTSRVLAAVPAGERPALVDRFVTRVFESGDKLTTEGESPDGLHLIASGGVAVVRVENNDEPFVLATLGVGDIVGEVALVLRRKASADVVAIHPTVTLFLPRAAFLELVREHPAILVELYDLAVKRDEETTWVASQEALTTTADDYVLL